MLFKREKRICRRGNCKYLRKLIKTDIKYFYCLTQQYAAIIHVGINDILRSKHYDELDELPGNIIKVRNTCQKYNTGKIYISVILLSTRTNITIFDIHKKLRNLYRKYKFEFIDHQQITTKFLWNDGIHLLDTGKSIGQNFVNRVSSFFCKNDSFLTDPHFQETIR